MIEAVIFDFDGVIGDTMSDNCKAWQHAFAVYGFDMVPAEYYRLEGMGRYQIADFFIKKYSLDPSIRNTVVEDKERNYKNNNTFRIYDGIKPILALLKLHSIPIGIVTGASKDRIMEHLEKEIADQLSALITADDVVHTKPDPEPYLQAIRRLNKVPENCLVIENAILGIRSAKAAGCRCYAIETTLSKEDLAIADETFSTHEELLIKLESLFR